LDYRYSTHSLIWKKRKKRKGEIDMGRGIIEKEGAPGKSGNNLCEAKVARKRRCVVLMALFGLGE